LRKLILPLLIIFINTLSAQQQYLWPTDASKNLTSVFAEFRPRHYHGGIDIKTWNQNGYDVFAIDDGYVYRIKTSPFGYGKVVYLKLKDGNIAVFAHLSRFNDALEKRVRKEQYRKGRYSIELFLQAGEFPYSKGDIIAYSGDTGIGVSHLHFEIRDANNRPRNPLLYYPKLKDRIRPTFTKLAIIPATDTSWVEMQPFAQVYSINRPRKGFRKMTPRIPAYGGVKIAFDAFDQANDVPNTYSIHHFTAYANDSLIMQAYYDEFAFNQTKLIELDRNFGLWRNSYGRFQHIDLHPRNNLPFYDFELARQQIEVHPGEEKRIKIEIADFNGNSKTLTFTLVGQPPLRWLEQWYDAKKDRYLLRSEFYSDLPYLQIQGPAQNKKAAVSMISGAGDRWFFDIPTRIPLLNLRAVKPELQAMVQINNNTGSKTFDTRVTFTNRRAAIRLSGQNGFANEDSLHVFFNDQLIANQSYRVRNHLMQHLKLPPRDGRLAVYLKGQYQQNLAFRDELFYVNTYQERSLTHGPITLSIPYKGFYDDTYIRFENRPLADFKDLLPIAGSIVIEPFAEPVSEAIEVQYEVPDSVRNAPNIGLFYHDKRKGWIFLGANKNGTCTSRVKSLETFALFKDVTAPKIIPISFYNGQKLGQKPKFFKWQVLDKGSGFPGDQNFFCKLNNKTVIIEFDPEEDLLILPTFDLIITPGKHSFVVTAIDNLGNKTEKNFSFTLTR
jgi:hypothetical protein